MRGHKVVVIDTDIGLRNLDVIMGLENRIVYDLVNVIEGECKMHQAMIRDKHNLELFLIPAAQTRDKDSIEPDLQSKYTDPGPVIAYARRRSIHVALFEGRFFKYGKGELYDG